MLFSPATPGEGTDANSKPLPDVAGRIDASPGELDQAVDGFIAHLQARKKKAGSGRAFRQVLRAWLKETGYRRFTDFTYENVIGYLDGKVAAGEWKGGTYNRNLSCFNSFAKYLKRNKKITENPLSDAERADDDSEPDCRAGSTKEARTHIRHAWVRTQADRRSKGRRDLYWACLWGHGCRPDEPARWLWRRHMMLDGPHPYIRWTKDINKNKKDQECALAPWLAELLRAHREDMRRLAETMPVIAARNRRTGAITLRKVSPDDPEGVVFPWVPPRHTFRADLVAAGLAATDERGLGLSPRSARKYFKTEMNRLKVSGDMIRRLMRHAPHPDERYFDPPLEEQALAAAVVPILWPEAISTSCAQPAGGQSVDNHSAPDGNLTAAKARTDYGATTPMVLTPNIPIGPSAGGSGSPEWYPIGLTPAQGSVGMFTTQGPLGPEIQSLLTDAIGSTGLSPSLERNAEGRTHNPLDPTRTVTAFLASLVELLRLGAAGHGHERR